jgi:RHS repeat-associated protein
VGERCFCKGEKNESAGVWRRLFRRIYYYPFGMGMEGSWNSDADPGQNYLYNGKERDSELGLSWDHYGFRMYDASIGRFTGVDPISDQFAHLSTYNYASNDPVGKIDLHGLQGTYVPGGIKGRLEDTNNDGKVSIEEKNASREFLKEAANMVIDEIPFLGEAKALSEGDVGGAILSIIPFGGLAKKGWRKLKSWWKGGSKGKVPGGPGAMGKDPVLPDEGGSWSKKTGDDLEFGDCEGCAGMIQKRIGGDIIEVTSPGNALGKITTPDGQEITSWIYHRAVQKDGKVYDAITGPNGMTVDAYKGMFEHGDYLNFDKVAK